MEVRRLSELTSYEIDNLKAKGCKLEPYTANGVDMVYIIHPMIPKNKD